MSLFPTTAERIATACNAMRNCIDRGNPYGDKWAERLDWIERNCLPSGSGFDNGTTIDRGATDLTRVVLNTAFHHMNENGYYDGWTEHKITVRPTFAGLDVRISGRDRNGIKDYIGEMIAQTLGERWMNTEYPE